MIEWFDSDWSEKGFCGWLNGIYSDLVPHPLGWEWMVLPTSARCETPEVFGYGVEATLKDAQAVAEEKLLEADSTYQTIVYS